MKPEQIALLVFVGLVGVAGTITREWLAEARRKRDERKRLAEQTAAVARELFGAIAVWDRRYTVLIRTSVDAHPFLACRWFHDPPTRWQLLQLAWHRYRYGAHMAIACSQGHIPERAHVQAAKLRIGLSEQSWVLNWLTAQANQERALLIAQAEEQEAEQKHQQAERTRQQRLENLAKARAARWARRHA